MYLKTEGMHMVHIDNLHLEIEDLERQEEALDYQETQHEQVDATVESQFDVAVHRLREARKVLAAQHLCTLGYVVE